MRTNKTIINKIYSVFIAIVICFTLFVTACGRDEVAFMKIEMAKAPDKTVYDVGEELDPAGGALYEVMADLTRTEVPLTNSDVQLSEPDMSTPGQKRVMVNYRNDTTSFMIYVNQAQTVAPGAEISEIKISAMPAKTTYSVNETFSAEGGVITVGYTDGSEFFVDMTDEDVVISAPDMAVIGDQSVTVIYGGVSTSFAITVNPQAPVSEEGVTSISMRTNPADTIYETGETLNIAGGAIDVTYSDGSKLALSLQYEGVQVTSPNMTTPGTKTVTVTFGGATTTFTITVNSAVPPVSTENVVRVTISKEPDRVEYFIGDTFDPSGGEIEITYRTDEGTEVVTAPMIAGGIEFSAPDMSTAGSKSVRVTVGGRRANFNITVVRLAGIVTFDLGYEGSENQTVRVAENRTVSKPEEDPVREGYTFRGWYEDAACTVEYEFGRNIITGDISVYASWTSDASESYSVTYRLNYYGVRRSTFTQYVQSGESARELAAGYATPVRSEFEFEGWFTDADATQEYNGQPITANTVLYAGWTKAKVNDTYTFEAENVDLTGMVGPGYSGEATGAEMIVNDSSRGASNGKYVSYLYRKGLTLNFRFASSEVVSDATVSIYLAAEFDNVSLSQDNYTISINGQLPDYSISFVNGAEFTALTFTGVSLKEGENIIQLITNNDVNPAGGGTYEGTAPMVDCIKITTSAVLMWDENYGLPANT